MYTRDLLALDCARPRELRSVHHDLLRVRSPLSERLPRWHTALAGHPDRDFVHYVLHGLETGFRVGFDHASPLGGGVSRNMQSAHLHPAVIDSYIGTEVAEGRMFGPFPQGHIPGLHTNLMGVIPKGHTPGKWRLITDLSHPEERSVNDGIQPQLCSLSYTSVEAVAVAAQRLGRGALLAKLDIKSAYRLVPVHPQDRCLLGIEWKGARYVDGMLPFGLRSAPKIFTAVADALEWVVLQRGVTWVAHYLDDFITMGPACSEVCGQNLERILAIRAENWGFR